MNSSDFIRIFLKKRFFLYPLSDTLILLALIYFKSNLYQNITSVRFLNIFIFCIFWTVLNYIFGVYSFKLGPFLFDSIKVCLKNTSKLFISISLLYLINSILLKIEFLSSNDPIFSINFIFLYILFTLLFHISFIFYLYKKDSFFKEWILIGDNNYDNIINKNFQNPHFKFKLKLVQKLSDLRLIDFKKNNYEGVIISSERLEESFDFSFLNNYGLSFIYLKDWCKLYLQRYPPDFINSFDIVRIKKILKDKTIEFQLKRIGDILLSLIILLVFSPALIIFSCLIYLEDRGPIIYSQIRTGFNLKQFRIYKLRSMYVNSERNGAAWAISNDSRVSKVGKIIRATRIDELPQLISVLKGEMSLIGPRPERPEFDQLLNKKIPFYYDRYLIKPGLSGWAQVNYPYGASEKDSRNKLSYDLFYIENFSFFLDFIIFIKTIKLVINAKGSEQGSKI